MDSPTASSIDLVLAEALPIAAMRLTERNRAGERVLEAQLDEELIAACSPAWRHGVIKNEGRRHNYPFHGWKPLPGGPDVAFYDSDGNLSAIVEDKWSLDGDNLSELTNDVFKLTAAYHGDRFLGGYLVAGAPVRLWDRPAVCADWFGSEAGAVKRLALVDFVVEHLELWAWIRAHSAGAPAVGPAEVLLSTVVVVPIEISDRSGQPEPWELKCVRVAPAPDTREVELPSISAG